jgi:hypothetical protein
MTIARTVTMLRLAREALERCDNDPDAAQTHLLRRLRDEGVLLEAWLSRRSNTKKLRRWRKTSPLRSGAALSFGDLVRMPRDTDV